ncbi:DUF998 domain-containing protein [Cryobacterium melibiosiphilum]|uniref:DUF998 domain-containing protein n=2 Tax=Cryobacterium melibiosiphilum TaxID=995039 RepID=A0A3A5MKK9_9MICO|nr:DUF998 domain-containing protein [Cryobacterium melibiosiphilum]
MIGVAVYVAVDVVLQFLPPHYSPISEAESNLAAGPFGWIMNLNFLGRAVTSFALVGALVSVAGAARSSGRLPVPSLPVPSLPVPRLLVPGLALLTLGGVCSAVLTFFPTEIAPAGQSVVATSVVGTVHLLSAIIGFSAALLAIVLLTVWIFRSGCLPAARRSALAFTVVAAAGLVFLGLTLTVVPALLGLAERLCLVGILGWTFSVARGIRRRR